MPEANEKFVITLMIGNTPQKYTVPRSKERDYRQAAELINEQFNQYRERYPNQAEEQYNALVMLHLALRSVQQQNQADMTPLFDSLSKLSKEMADALK